MLSHLTVHHLAIVEHLDLGFKSGMTVLTGETGAGKSILIDALSLVLGERADSNSIRHGFQTAEVIATFELEQLPQIATWLCQQGLGAEGECIVRRSIHKDGRSRAYINGYLCPLTQVRALGEQLVDIHGQHQNHALLKSDYQRLLVDEYAGHHDLLAQVKQNFEQWQHLQKELLALQSLQGHTDKLALLQYQIGEIEALGLKANELETLETEHRALTHAEGWLANSTEALALLQEGQSAQMDAPQGKDICTALHQTLQCVHNLGLLGVQELLKSALIQIEESASEIRAFSESIVYDPKRLGMVEDRMSVIHALSRKHKIEPEKLFDHLQCLQEQAAQLSDIEGSLTEIKNQVAQLKAQYQQQATLLTASRQKAASLLSDLVVKSLYVLEMPNGRFEVRCIQKGADYLSAAGNDEIDFLVSTNPGHPLQLLKKIASGGELSRISLAIQVITAQKMTIPTLIFDEVDVGISGKTAEIVGKLIRTLSKATQVLCVTHLPQVAAQSHQHYKVEKVQTTESTTTHIQPLSPEQKVQEIARLLGGITISQSALHHAEEMVQSVV
jgi:DNA repair protein RecN (Recombination protein N)